ncbi:hypothetical protein BCR34DRAFT_613167 [Clohesyomyces aquaticus]|uniref:Jacalin-type lectin domain-containing protein n=1 Tax=Clohesyomyces aquaticus TaxID=1231657 RepID=A0A1Y1ZUE5_9PLEO|nr:hypothetical protein BCR34DRAFT_613167 [Clohesyomyces aquaticus]
MFFNPRTLILGGVSLLFAAGAVASDCDDGPWAPVSMTGADTGAPWCDTMWKQGPVIAGVEAWANNERLKAIRFTFSDGTVGPMHGREDGDKHGAISWHPADDKIVQATTWGDGRGRRVGRVVIKTAGGKVLDVGKDTDGQAQYDHVVGNAGIMMGAFGHAGYDIDLLGFNFLRGEIKKITVGDVKFDQSAEDLNSQKKGLKPQSLDYQHVTNGLTTTITKELSGERSYTQSKTWTSSTMISFGFKYTIEVSGEILDIGAKASTELSFGVQQTETYTSQYEETNKFAWKFSTPVGPGEEAFCRSFAWEGEFNGKYQSTVTIELEDGFKIQYPEIGEMKQVHWSEKTDECQKTDFNDGIPKIPSSKRAISFVA